MRQSKITKWINVHYGATLKDSDYNHVKTFLLLWNLFENDLFNNQFQLEEARRRINTWINEDKIKQQAIDKIFSYFRNRYTEDGMTTPLFDGLEFRNPNNKDLVANILQSDMSTLDEKTYASMIIVYRYRNNLFHGLKDITRINYQRDNFLHANRFLKILLETKFSY